ncbi:sensor histidine kinase [Actinacidiphila bryophytorum]|uniref:histidine kinase n=2 Tax=Actinacidiphila bryophytorum TaxID=1436133 RepID=A0A9W4MH51_9ACTN|nr:ATP-binding protein [Actinacidiphila bryophytorum]MBM9438331.1 HAMP domain-containing protein [Actinacidiphila bryophytorum]MBN6542643.1 HAMP domain-containing protein [Actinacidiphila bryophytorum]CAG7658051.1 Histidine kinase [Actinacidiphila bryophytorum]
MTAPRGLRGLRVLSALRDRVVRPGPPRRTVRLRLRLAALYGGLFLASGVALLAVTYGLVARAVDRPPTVVKHAVTAAPGAGAYSGQAPGSRTDPAPVPTAPLDDDSLQKVVQRTVGRQKSDLLHTLLVQSGIALGLMSLTSVLLGWIVAGRILRPLRTITATARDISATSLNRRLALNGPRDELRELGETFDALLGRLDTSFQAQRQFVANASHELRTPLARQRVLGQVALADPEPTVESLRGAHERILAAGDQQERLIEALLTLARGHAGIDVRRRFDLAILVEEAVAGRRTDARERRVTLHPSAGEALASGHRALAERLIANLLDNAIRYNVAGGHVEVSTATTAGRAVLTVANTGPTVPEDAVERILLPFQRLDPARAARGSRIDSSSRNDSSEGLGLGLSIVAAIASAHDASLTAAARPGGGLVVTIAFPTAVGPAAQPS